MKGEFSVTVAVGTGKKTRIRTYTTTYEHNIQEHKYLYKQGNMCTKKINKPK